MNRSSLNRRTAIPFCILRYFLVFAVPVLAGLLFFKNREVYPFGENCILSIDLWGQYFPMFRQYARTDSIAEAMYSWNGALGFNNFVQSAFYCRSLFLIPLKWIPTDGSIIWINTVCLLRFGLSSVTCLWFLESKFRSRHPILMALSVCYGLCAYSLAFIMQFMWTDLMIFAPLILLGLERLMDNRSPLLYLAALAMSIYTNFYVAFGVCIFTVVWFMSEIVKRIQIDPSAPLRRRISNRRELAITALRFVLTSGLAGAVNAVSILPTLMGLSHSASASTAKVDFSQWYHSLADCVSAMLPQTGISLGYGVANIATGLCLFLLIPLYFFNTAIRFRDKFTSGACLVFLYIGLNYNPLDYVFNGFHFPNQLPGRWSFLFSLALVTTAASAIMHMKGVKLKSIFNAYLVGIFFLLYAKYGNISTLKADTMRHWIGWLSLTAALLLMTVWCAKHADTATAADASSLTWTRLRRGILRVSAVTCACAVSTVIAVESVSNAVDVLSEIDNGVGTSSMTHYLNATNLFEHYGAMVDSPDNTFYRTENNGGWTFDDGQLGGYKGMTYYGSTMNGNTYQLLKALGNRVYTLNISSLYNPSSPVQNGIFGIRKFIDKGQNLNNRLEEIREIARYDDAILWENPTALPLGFVADDAILDFQLPEDLKALTTQSNLLNALCGQDMAVFRKRDTEMTFGNCELDPSDDWNRCYYHCPNTALPVIFDYTYICQTDDPIYLEHNFRAGTMQALIGGKTVNIDMGTEPFKYLGSFAAGTEIRVHIEATGHQTGCYGLNLYTFDEDAWQRAYQKLNANDWQVTSFRTTRVEGTITMPQDGVLFTTVPQDGGWRVYVDGKRIETELIADTLISVRVPQGEHTVTFRYRVPGIIMGGVVSVIALMAAVWFLWWTRRYTVKEAAAPASTTPKQSIANQAPIPSKRVMIDDDL